MSQKGKNSAGKGKKPAKAATESKGEHVLQAVVRRSMDGGVRLLEGKNIQADESNALRLDSCRLVPGQIQAIHDRCTESKCW